MKTQSPDTHPDMERLQIELFRKAGPERRVQIALSLSQQLMALTKRTIREMHPDTSEVEKGLIFVSLVYGQDLANRVRSYLQERGEI